MRYGVTLATAAGLALAVSMAPPAAAQEDRFLALSLGMFDVLRDDTATEARIEYRSGKRVFGLGPMFGVMFNSDASAYIYSGLNLDLVFGNWVLMPNLAVGAYFEGSGKDLGHVLEFRSGADLYYRFDNGVRIGIAFHHISNANIGDHNPGAESLVITYAIPYGRP